MFRRFAIVILVFAGFSAAPWTVEVAFAQDNSLDEPATVTMATAVAAVQFAATDQSTSQVPRELRPQTTRTWTTPVMTALHVSTIATQMLDVHSTMRALDRGAVEANPMMSGIVKNRAAFIGMKAAVGAGVVFATHKMAQRNKIAAIVTSAAFNSVMLTVAHHNYKVARSLQ